MQIHPAATNQLPERRCLRQPPLPLIDQDIRLGRIGMGVAAVRRGLFCRKFLQLRELVYASGVSFAGLLWER